MIELSNVSISYGEKNIIKELSFTFKNGFNAVMGPSGSGKTSIANALLNLIPYS